MKRILISGAALALAVTGVGVGSADPGSPEGGNAGLACLDGTVTWDPTSIWPPNHKMQTVNITYTSTDDHAVYDMARVAIGVITHDQILPDGSEMNGSGNTDIDSSGSLTSAEGPEEQPVPHSVEVRQERSGRDETGRTYTIPVTCTEYSSTDPTGLVGESETVNITVAVPHDQRRIKDEG